MIPLRSLCHPGSGIFASPGVVVNALGSANLALVAWVVGGAMATLGSLCYAELGTMMPGAGGEVLYLARSYGRWAAFQYSWVSILVARSASISIIALVFAEYLASITFADKGKLTPFQPHLTPFNPEFTPI